LTNIDEASGAVGGNAEQARELASGIAASKDLLDSLTGAFGAVGLDGKASETQAASDRAEELTGHANGLADALDSLRAQIEALKGLLTAANGGNSNSPTATPAQAPLPSSSPGITRPVHPPDPGRRPTGPATVLDGEKTQGLKRENESALALARVGYEVQQNPVTNAVGKNPDYRIQGQDWDCYSPSGSSTRTIHTTLRKKVGGGQASRIVLNLDDCGASPSEIRARLERSPIRGLQEIKIVQGGEVQQFYPWDSEVR